MDSRSARLMPAAGLPAEEVKACCAALYESEWARFLLGGSLHPGGVGLTLRLAQLLDINESTRVLDVASGSGTSAIALAREFGCRVRGVDLSEQNVARARDAARRAGLAHLVDFEVGDAEQLPIPSGWADVVICECAFCTFPDKPTAARELARVVRPGGTLGLTDLTLEGALPPELQTLAGWVACVADAQPLDRYAAHLEAAGFAIERTERHDPVLRELIRDLRLKLLGAELGARLGRLPISPDDIGLAKRLSKAALDAAESGALGYALILGRAPDDRAALDRSEDRTRGADEDHTVPPHPLRRGAG